MGALEQEDIHQCPLSTLSARPGTSHLQWQLYHVHYDACNQATELRKEQILFFSFLIFKKKVYK